MLDGYTSPLTPTGRSSLVPAPPWHFAGDVVMLEFRANAEAARGLLPEALDLASEEAWCAAIFGEWQSCTTGGDELLDPCRAQYKEFYIAIACRLSGDLVARCPYCWVDRDFSLVRGMIQGYPKKLGSIWVTRPTTVGEAGPRIEAGARFAGTLSSADRRLVELSLTLRRPVGRPPELFVAPLIHTRVFPSWADVDGAARVEEHVTARQSASAFAEVWEGEGEVRFFESPHDELAALEPIEFGRGYRFSYSETLTGGDLVRLGDGLV